MATREHWARRKSLIRAIYAVIVLGVGTFCSVSAFGQSVDSLPPDPAVRELLNEWVRLGYKLPKNEVLVELSPTVGPKAFELIARSAEPTIVKAEKGQELSQIIQKQCGVVTSPYLGFELNKLNPNLKVDDKTGTITQTSQLKVPACAKIYMNTFIKVSEGDTLESIAKRTMFVGWHDPVDNHTLQRIQRGILTKNPGIEADRLPVGGFIMLPVYTEPTRFKLKEGVKPTDFAIQLAMNAQTVDRPGIGEPIISAQRFRVNTNPFEPIIVRPEVAAAPANCEGRSENWPFNIAQLIKAVGQLPSGEPAVVAVVDTGIEGVTKDEFPEVFPEYFFSINRREWDFRKDPNVIDPDNNNYNKDLIGVSFAIKMRPETWPPHHPPAPVSRTIYQYWDHGTHVAGLVLGGTQLFQLPNAAASPGERLRDKLLRGRIKLKIVNVTTKFEAKEIAQIGPDWVRTALEYAKQQNVHIVNLSMESPVKISVTPAMLHDDALLIVAAAGNSKRHLGPDTNNSLTIEPGAWSADDNNVITVSAADGRNGLADISNWGAEFSDLAAPGCRIESFVGGKKEETRIYSGTSQATPLVSMTAALLRSSGIWDAHKLKVRILMASDFQPKLVGKVRQAGLLNVAKALSYQKDLIELPNAPTGDFVLGEIKYPEIFNICGGRPVRKADMRRIIPHYPSDDGKEKVRYFYVAEGGGGSKLSKPVDCDYQSVNDIRFLKEGATEPEPLVLTDLRDVVFGGY